MKIKIKYFASLRDSAGKSEEILNSDAKTPSELFKELKTKYNFSQEENQLKVAINEQYEPFSTLINELDTIVFIPPVAGG
jgi:molybdenum cofactor guanylyltransferase